MKYRAAEVHIVSASSCPTFRLAPSTPKYLSLPPQIPASFSQPAAWAALVTGYIGLVFSDAGHGRLHGGRTRRSQRGGRAGRRGWGRGRGGQREAQQGQRQARQGWQQAGQGRQLGRRAVGLWRSNGEQRAPLLLRSLTVGLRVRMRLGVQWTCNLKREWCVFTLKP